MSAKELVMKAPELCGVPNAARYSKIAKDIWKEEEDNHESVFARTEEDADNEGGRLDPLFGWLWKAITGKYSQKAFYIRELMNFLLFRHYIKDHGRSDLIGHSAELEARLTLEEGLHPDVAELLTVEQAVKGFWT